MRHYKDSCNSLHVSINNWRDSLVVMDHYNAYPGFNSLYMNQLTNIKYRLRYRIR